MREGIQRRHTYLDEESSREVLEKILLQEARQLLQLAIEQKVEASIERFNNIGR